MLRKIATLHTGPKGQPVITVPEKNIPNATALLLRHYQRGQIVIIPAKALNA